MVTFILIALAVAVIGGTAVASSRIIRDDGYGSRPTPCSHYDPFPTSLPR